MNKTVSFHKKIIWLALAAFVVCVFSAIPSHAQNKDALIIDEEYEEAGGVLDRFREYVFLNVGTYVTPTGPNKRNIMLGSGGIDVLKDNFQVYVEGRVWRENIQFRQRLVDDEDETRTVEVETDEVELTEAYVSFSPVPQFNIKAGRRKVIWGQFNIFSPVFFTLPFRTQNIQSTFSKVNFGLPQNNVQVSFSPYERFELQGYFFLKTIVDPLIAEVARESEGVKKKDLEDHNQYAARVLFYPDWGTVAATYLNGRNTFEISLRETLTGGRSPGLSKLESYSLEASVPKGKWNFKGELVYRKSEGDLDSVSDSPPTGSPREAYRMWVLNENRGRLYGETTTFLGGLGIEYTAENWKVEVAGYLLNEAFTGGAKEGADLLDEFTDDPAAGLLSAPFFDAAYFITDDKQNFIGLTAGFLATFASGASLYAVGNFDRFEHLGAGTLQLVVALDVLRYFSDSQLSDLNDEDGEYELDDDFVVAPRFGLVWRF